MSGLRFGLSLSMQGRGGKAWRDYDLFETGSGFLYDFNRADTLFQEATGTTPAGVDQNVGLALDVSKWGGKTLAQVLAGQPPAFIADFASGITGWSAINQAVLSNSAGKLRIEPKIGNSYGAASSPSFATVVGRSYQLSIEISPAGATNTTVQANGVDILPTTSRSGTYTAIFRALATTYIVTAVVNNASGVAVSFDSISVKEIPGNHASQATSGARPVRKAGGLTRYDGSDDNLLLNYLSQPVMTLMTKCGPAVPGAIRLLLGACDAASANRIQLQSNNAGNLSARVGSSGQVDTSFPMNAVSIVGLVIDGSNLGIIANGVVILTTSYSGAPTSTMPLRIGAFNNNGVSSNFWNGDIYHALAINRALTPAEVVKLTNAWSAA